MTIPERAQELLETLAGPGARLRPDQETAIVTAVGERRRTLVVQRTGFGKSAIYFIATRLLRDAGAGPTLVVSPLLALMRDQVAAAERMGVRSATINSTNLDDWTSIEKQLAGGELDLLCISPERFNNPGFVRRILPALSKQIGLLVIDEAHCISDWGHDFRPDYRRIRDAIANLAPDTPIIATTATANARVTRDVAEQLGDDVTVLRGSLDRESLALGVVSLPSLAERLAWLAQRIPTQPGTGIVYCLTVERTTQVAEFLRSCDVDAHAYSSNTSTEERDRLEDAFKRNEIKVLVATSALGMGVDKPDVRFVYHLGAPPSPIAYYQQVGRAGRSVDRAEASLLPGAEDQKIWEWFASVGLPPEPLVRRVLDEIGTEPTTIAALERAVDLRRGRLETLLKILDVDGAVERVDVGWVTTGRPWEYDTARIDAIRAARVSEADAMLTYARGDSCLMQFLRRSLDDPEAAPCGRCAACVGEPAPTELDPELVQRAINFLRGVDVVVEARKQWPRGLDEPKGNIAVGSRAEVGRALCRVEDSGWWAAVRAALDSAEESEGATRDVVVGGLATTMRRWPWTHRPTWITWVPSRRHDAVLAGVAAELGRIGKLPVVPVLERVRDGVYQEQVGNSVHRFRNVWGAFRVDRDALPDPETLAGPVLVLDDLLDSGWTMTVVAALLRAAGAGAVLPLVLARQ